MHDVLGITRRGHEVDARVAWLDVQLDELACVLGDVAALGNHERDGLAHVADVAARERRWHLELLAEHRVPRLTELPVEVLRCEHGDNARELARRSDVEARDRGLREVAPQKRRVERSGGLRRRRHRGRGR